MSPDRFSNADSVSIIRSRMAKVQLKHTIKYAEVKMLLILSKIKVKSFKVIL